MSWISLTDEIRAIRFLLDPDAADRRGPYNLTAPNPVTDAELTSALHAAFKRPDFRLLRVPESALRLGLGEMSSELLNSARVLPRRLLAEGFQFECPTLAAALAAELELWDRDSEHESHVLSHRLEPCPCDVVIDVTVDNGEGLA